MRQLQGRGLEQLLVNPVLVIHINDALGLGLGRAEGRLVQERKSFRRRQGLWWDKMTGQAASRSECNP